MQLGGVTAVITGGVSGLGEATARHLRGLGANVVLADLNAERGEALSKEMGEGVLFSRTDVTRSEDLQAAMDMAESAFGGLHVLVCCAGILPAGRTLSKSGPFNLGAFQKAIAVNLVGVFDANRLAAEKMAKNEPNEWGERGVIINTSSVAGYEGQIGQVAYSASKGGVIGMTLTLARDLASYGIRVCSIAPGVFDTPMFDSVPEGVKTALGNEVPFPPRLGRPQEYAMLAQHIVENPMLNGETIRLDGALRMPPRTKA